MLYRKLIPAATKCLAVLKYSSALLGGRKGDYIMTKARLAAMLLIFTVSVMLAGHAVLAQSDNGYQYNFDTKRLEQLEAYYHSDHDLLLDLRGEVSAVRATQKEASDNQKVYSDRLFNIAIAILVPVFGLMFEAMFRLKTAYSEKKRRGDYV